MKSKHPTTIAKRNYGFTKGRLAEGIVERLFCSLDMDVYPIGLEVKNPHVARLRSKGKIKTNLIEKFEYGPDFLICQKDKDHDAYNLFEIEVKFRTNSRIDVTELKKYEDPSILFVLLNMENFYCIENKDIQSKIEKHPNKDYFNFTKWPLLKDTEIFNFSVFDREIIGASSCLIKATLGHIEAQKDLEKRLRIYSKNTITNNMLKKKFNKNAKI